MNRVRFPDGSTGNHLRVREREGAAVLVLDERDRTYLHRGYHYAADREFLEIIRGFGEGLESARETALRELREESSFEYEVVEPVRRLGNMAPNSTLLAAVIPLFLVRVRPGKSRPMDEKGEALSGGAWYEPSRVRKLVADGGVEDSFTLCALSLAWAQGTLRLD